MPTRGIHRPLTLHREKFESAIRTFGFLPNSAVNDLLTPDTVRTILFDELSHSPHHEIQTLVAKVFGAPAKKVFIVLVLIEEVDALPSILDRGMTDRDLPLMYPRFIHNRDRFIEVQWQLIAPVLHKGKHAEFDECHILPYVNETRLQILESSYGTVRKAEIHHAHHTLAEPQHDSDNNYIVAVKTLVDDDPESRNVLEREFEREKDILKLLNQIKHPSIMELLCTYQHGPVFSFVFPYAELDLARFLEMSEDDVPRLLRNGRDIYWAMYGLAHALTSMHEYSFADDNGQVHHGIYHHDLHPGNILIRGKVFFIADFGTASTYTARQPPNPEWTSRVLCRRRWVRGTETYGPPEIDPEPRKQEVDPFALDLWSFGCILLEVLIHTVRGHTALRTFREGKDTWHGRSRDECFHREFALKAEVAKQVNLATTSLSNDSIVLELLSICGRLLNPKQPSERREVKICDEMLSALYSGPSPLTRPLRLANDELKMQKDMYPLHFAASIDDKTGFWESLTLTRDGLQSVDMEGRLPLHWCPRAASLDLMESILSTTDKHHLPRILHTKDNNGDTPLSLAVQYHDVRGVQLLVEADRGTLAENGTHAIFQSNTYGKTPLHLAVETRRSDLVRYIIGFIAKGPHCDEVLRFALLSKDAKGRIPLHYAAESPFSKAHLTLLDAAPILRDSMLGNADDYGITPLGVAREAGFTYFACSNFGS